MKNWYRCKNCDKYTDGDAKFCVYCGTPIEKTEDNMEPSVIIDNKFLLSDKELLKNFIDEEVKKIVDRAYTRARDILSAHEDKLHAVAGVLLEKEKIEGPEFDKIFEE